MPAVCEGPNLEERREPLQKGAWGWTLLWVQAPAIIITSILSREEALLCWKTGGERDDRAWPHPGHSVCVTETGPDQMLAPPQPFL